MRVVLVVLHTTLIEGSPHCQHGTPTQGCKHIQVGGVSARTCIPTAGRQHNCSTQAPTLHAVTLSVRTHTHTQSHT